MLNWSDIWAMAHREWSPDNPYSKESFLKKMSRETEDKSRWLYTFGDYAKSIYKEGETSYIDVAQKNMIGHFVALWPGSATHTPDDTAIIEISKREKDGTMPDTMEASNKLEPTMMVSYKWQTITIPLENPCFQNNQWFDVLNKVYDDISKHLKKYETIGEEQKNKIREFVIQTLKEKNYLKAPLEKSLSPIQWRKDRLLKLFGFWKEIGEPQKTEKKEPKWEEKNEEPEIPELVS